MLPRMKFLIVLIAFTVVLKLLSYAIKFYDVQVDPDVIFYPWNFMPLTALCLYSGAYVTDRRWSIGLPLLTVLISDLGIWALTGRFSSGFPIDCWSVFLSYVLIIVMGHGLNRRTWPARAVDALARGLLAETLFFLVTNFAYFLIQTVHPQTLAGLIDCYVVAIPFAKTSFVSTAFYSVLLFSPLALHAAGEESPNTKPELQTALSQ